MLPTHEDDAANADLPLAPVSGKSADELLGEWAVAKLPEPPAIQDDAISRHFTLRELMLLVLFAGIGFGIMRAMPIEVFAGAAGIGTVAGLALITIYKPHYLLIYLAWWTVLAMYIVSASIAVVTRG